MLVLTWTTLYVLSNLWYVGYGAWFLIWWDEAWDDGNTKNGHGWKQIGSGLRSGPESPSFVSPCFEELGSFLLEREESRSGLNRSLSVWQKWGNEIKEGAKDWDCRDQTK